MSQNQESEKRQPKALLLNARLPRCFGTLKQHIIICNECSKQFECLTKYKSLEPLPQNA